MGAALDYVERMSLAEIEGNNQMISNLETSVIKPLNSLHSELNSSHKSLQSKIHSLHKALDNQYERLGKNLNQFEGALKEAQQNWSKGVEITKDPWVEKVNCHLALKELSRLQQDFNSQLEEMFKVLNE